MFQASQAIAVEAAQRESRSAAAGGDPARLHASLDLEFRYDGIAGRTVLALSRQQAPLKVVRAFAHADGGALAHLHNVSGGILGGDNLRLAVRLGARAHVQLTTTGATRIYRPRATSQPAIQSNEIVIGEDALLEYVPDAIIPFAGARFAQRTVIRLAPGAGLFWWEIVAAGREARGEIFEYESLEMAADITVDNRLIASERAHFEPRLHPPSSLARMGPHRTWATFYICRVGVEPAVWLDLENHLREVAAEFSPSSRALWGISTLVAHGVAVRCLAMRGRDVVAGLHALWRAAKLRLYGRAPVMPRKVN